MMPRKEIIGDATLYLGDCLEVMAGLPEGSVAAVVTDPPYCSGARTSADLASRGGMSRGKKWAAKPLPNDRMTVTGFMWLMRQVCLLSLGSLQPGGSVLSFIDWRQYPTLYGVMESANLRVQGMVVWDKKSMALGNGFRNQHELIIHAANGTPNIFHRGTPNVLQVPRLGKSDLHPTEKPFALIEKLLQVISNTAQTILDPFMGSGTTGVACANLGRKFIGVEMEPKYFDIACRRIELAQNQQKLPLVEEG